MSHWKGVLLLLGASLTVLIFQNCGPAKMPGAPTDTAQALEADSVDTSNEVLMYSKINAATAAALSDDEVVDRIIADLENFLRVVNNDGSVKSLEEKIEGYIAKLETSAELRARVIARVRADLVPRIGGSANR